MSLEGQLQSALQRYRRDADIHRNMRVGYKKKIVRKLTSPSAFVGAFAFGFIATVRTSARSQAVLSRDSQSLSRWQRFQNLRRSVLKTYGTWLALRTSLASHFDTSSTL